MTRAEFEDKILSDATFFARFVGQILEDSTGPVARGFLDWAWESYQAENEPDKEIRGIFLEQLRKEIKNDPDSGPKSEKARLALMYAEAYPDEFLKWATEKVADEFTPANKSWEKEAKG